MKIYKNCALFFVVFWSGEDHSNTTTKKFAHFRHDKEDVVQLVSKLLFYE